MSMATSPLTYRFLPADILTSSVRVMGKIMVMSTGAISILNDPTHSVLEVHDARWSRLDSPAKQVDHFEVTRMMKEHVYAVSVARREDLGPQALVRGGYTTVIEYPVRLTTQLFEVEGIMEYPGRFDFPSMMTEGTLDFVPLYKATLTGLGMPNLLIETGGLLINRRHIDLLALLSQRVKPQT